MFWLRFEPAITIAAPDWHKAEFATAENFC
jgi:hypothetical protein